MKPFEHVAVVGSSEASDPQVLRSVLEEFGLRVHLYRLYQKRNVEDFFAGRGLPKECRYTVLCAHGHGPDDDPKIRLEVVDQKDGDPDAVEGWERRPFDLSKGNVPGLVTAPRGVLVAGGCGAGAAGQGLSGGRLRWLCRSHRRLRRRGLRALVHHRLLLPPAG
jgi:hypothetical protein